MFLGLEPTAAGSGMRVSGIGGVVASVISASGCWASSQARSGGALPEPVPVRGAVAQPGAAEPDRRVRHLPPERPDRRRYPKLDTGSGVPACEIIDDHLADRVHLLAGDPVTTHLMRPERPGRQLVSV